MKKYTFAITTDDIRFEIERAAAELEEEELLHFPDSEARAEFLDDCICSVIDKFDFYEQYCPNWEAEVSDTAQLYGYAL